MEEKRFSAQQGDVIFEKIDSIPKTAKAKKNRVMIAEGEATGHMHALASSGLAEIFEDKDGTLFMKVEETTKSDHPATVVHEEHSISVLEPGNYKVHGVVEKDPYSDSIRRVRD